MSTTPPAHSGAPGRANPSAESLPIVLVHGAWLGEWCWEQVITALERRGRVAVAVSLRGSGCRTAENHPEITLGDHVADVRAAIDATRSRTGAEQVVLVGHSYGGRVITRVFSEDPDHIAHLVYVDAHAPVGSAKARQPAWIEAAPPDGMLEMSGVRLDADMVGGEERLAEVRRRLVPHPARTLREHWRVDLDDLVGRTYVHALGADAEVFRPYALVAALMPEWRYHEIDGPHLLPLTHPDELATIIAGV
jgi:pimeloyl-ACP methyl ester carboxylesterase